MEIEFFTANQVGLHDYTVRVGTVPFTNVVQRRGSYLCNFYFLAQKNFEEII